METLEDEDEKFLMVVDPDNIGLTDWSIMQQLFEWHIDVFGLIDKGLAIEK